MIYTGAERYSSYSGYADNFEFTGDFEDNTSRYESLTQSHNLIEHFRSLYSI